MMNENLVGFKNLEENIRRVLSNNGLEDEELDEVANSLMHMIIERYAVRELSYAHRIAFDDGFLHDVH